MRTIRALLPYTSIVLGIALIYAGWTFWARRQNANNAERQVQEQETKRDADVTERYGGGRLKILSFYGSPAVVPPGGKALVCYGVNNAKAVRIEPRIEEDLKPSLSRCLEVHPKTDTEYTLTAEDGAGAKAEQKFTLRVGK